MKAEKSSKIKEQNVENQNVIIGLEKKPLKMGSFFYNKNQMILVNYMDLYFNHKPTDCTLYSDDGYEFPIHQVSFITFKKKLLVLKCRMKFVMITYNSKVESLIINFGAKPKCSCKNFGPNYVRLY